MTKGLKIGALIPARLGSKRLPGKHLKVIADKPVIHHLIDRLAACRHIRDAGDIVVCVTEDPSDDPLVPVVEETGASVFRGSRDDIIRRFHDALAEHEFDFVVQANGDNLLTDPEYMNAGIDALLEDPKIDVTTCSGLPLGISSTCFTRSAMDKVMAAYRTERNDTGYTLFFTRTGLCQHLEIPPISPEHVMDEARLTLDYPEDLKVMDLIFTALYREGEVFGLSAVLNFLRRAPTVAQINGVLSAEYEQRTRDLLDLTYQGPEGSITRIEY